MLFWHAKCVLNPHFSIIYSFIVLKKNYIWAFITFVRCSNLIILNGVPSSVYQAPGFAGSLIWYNFHITILPLLLDVPWILISEPHCFKQIGLVWKFLCLNYASLQFFQPIFYAHNFPCAFMKIVIKDPLGAILGCYDCHTARPEKFISLQVKHFFLSCWHLDLLSISFSLLLPVVLSSGNSISGSGAGQIFSCVRNSRVCFFLFLLPDP